MKEVYVIATASTEPLPQDVLREAFEAEDVVVTFGENGSLFALQADESRVEVRFDARAEPLGWSPELLTGNAEHREALEAAKGFYKVAYEVGKPQGTVAVFEALWAVRTLLEHVEAVVVDSVAFKIHGPQDIEEITELDFDIRDHLSIHAVEVGEADGNFWVHTHGLSKFATLDVEIFSIREEDLPAAESFLHELCTDLAFGQGPPEHAPVSTNVGMTFMLVPADEGRTNLRGVDPESFEGHDNKFSTVVTTEGKHGLNDILKLYRGRFEEESEEESQAMKEHALKLLPLFKARFQRKGLMEPLTFTVRAPFEIHPEADEEGPDEEQLWAEVIAWDDDTVVGRLVDGGQHTTEWRKGAHAEIDESQINAIAVSREGRTLEPEELTTLLMAERPA